MDRFKHSHMRSALYTTMHMNYVAKVHDSLVLFCTKYTNDMVRQGQIIISLCVFVYSEFYFSYTKVTHEIV